MLPSYKYILSTTLLSSFFAIYGLVYNDNIILLVACLIAPTSNTYFNIVKHLISNNKIPLLSILIYTFIAIIIPVLVGLIFGVMFTVLKNKSPNKSYYNIPSENMLNRLDIHPINLILCLVIPFIVSAFLPYAMETNNIGLIIAISITLSFIIPLVNIGLIMGSHIIKKHNNKQLQNTKYHISNQKIIFEDKSVLRKLNLIDNKGTPNNTDDDTVKSTNIKIINNNEHNNNNYIIPVTMFLTNLLAIIFISIFTLKSYKKKGKLDKI